MDVRIFDAELEKFIKTLEKPTIARVLRVIDLLELFGNKLALPHSRKVSRDLFELRVRGKQEIRIFYVFNKGAAVLLHGFVKKSQRVPRKEMDTAIGKLRRLISI